MWHVSVLVLCVCYNSLFCISEVFRLLLYNTVQNLSFHFHALFYFFSQGKFPTFYVGLLVSKMKILVCIQNVHLSLSNAVLHNCILPLSFFEWDPVHFSVSIVFQTFEAKIHHLETRPCRKLKESLEGLEYFVRCEVHLSDVSTLIGSIKRNAEDVKTTKEVKCNTLSLLLQDKFQILCFPEVVTKNGTTAFNHFPSFLC